MAPQLSLWNTYITSCLHREIRHITNILIFTICYCKIKRAGVVAYTSQHLYVYSINSYVSFSNYECFSEVFNAFPALLINTVRTGKPPIHSIIINAERIVSLCLTRRRIYCPFHVRRTYRAKNISVYVSDRIKCFSVVN